MSNITVYTCITGSKDNLIEEQVKCEHDFIAFYDGQSTRWKTKKTYDRFKSDRRNSRIQKILAHQFIDTEYSVYIDGNIKLNIDPQILIDRYLKDHDIAVFKHPTRDCIYDEAMVCAKHGLDNAETIIEQAKTYEDYGYAKHKGLGECGLILRRHTDKVEQLNNAWWAEHCRHSVRDQISFMYAVDKVGIRVKFIDKETKSISIDHAIINDFLEIFSHLTSRLE